VALSRGPQVDPSHLHGKPQLRTEPLHSRLIGLGFSPPQAMIYVPDQQVETMFMSQIVKCVKERHGVDPAGDGNQHAAPAQVETTHGL
jgi:hypothetical protein